MNFKEVMTILKNNKVASLCMPMSQTITVYEEGLKNAYIFVFENNKLSHVEIMQTMVIDCDSIKAFSTIDAGIVIWLFNKNMFVGMFSASREILV